MTNFNAEAEGITPDDIVRRLIDAVPDVEDEQDGGQLARKVFRSADAG